jgi:hypothetical protein
MTPFNFLRYFSFREATEVIVFWIEMTPVPSRSRLFNWVMEAVGKPESRLPKVPSVPLTDTAGLDGWDN